MGMLKTVQEMEDWLVNFLIKQELFQALYVEILCFLVSCT